MSDVRITVDTGTGNEAEFHVEDRIVRDGVGAQRVLDEAYRQATAWIASLQVAR